MIVDRDENDHLRVQAQQAALFGLLKGGIPVAKPEDAWPALTEAARTTGMTRNVGRLVREGRAAGVQILHAIAGRREVEMKPGVAVLAIGVIFFAGSSLITPFLPGGQKFG